MASSKEYLDFILDQLSSLDEITYQKMMGEYIIYYRGKIVGGIYDNRFLLKPVEAAKKTMPILHYEIPYQGAKEMLLVEDVDNKEFAKEKRTLVNEGCRHIFIKRVPSLFISFCSLFFQGFR